MSQELAYELRDEFERITGISCKASFLEKGETHKPSTLRDGTKGVYVFLLNEEVCFKVGKANTNSKARWNSHHYSVDQTTPSTLTKSLLSNLSLIREHFSDTDIDEIAATLRQFELKSDSFKTDIKKLEKQETKSLSNALGLKVWIQKNISRIEFLLEAGNDDYDSNLLEALIQFRLKPIFEGKNA